MPRSPVETPLEKSPFSEAFLPRQISAFCPSVGKADHRRASALSLGREVRQRCSRQNSVSLSTRKRFALKRHV